MAVDRARLSSMALSHDGLPVIVVPNAQITVMEAGTTDPIPETLYAGATGGATLTNPFWADADGNFSFYLALPKSVNLLIDGTASGIGAYTLEYEPVMPSADSILAADGAGLIDRSTITGQVLTSLPTPLAGIGWALYNEAQYGRIGLTWLPGGARVAASGIYANYSGLISPPADHVPGINALIYTTPDAVNYGQVGAAYQLNVRRTGAGISGLTMVSATSTSITVTGLTATLNQYIGWTIQIPSQLTQLKITSNAATSTGQTVLTGSAGWKPYSGSPATPTGTPTDVVISYGSLHALDGLAVTIDHDAHAVMPFASSIPLHGYVKMPPGSAGQGIGVMGQVLTYSTESLSLGGELDSQNYTKRMARYDDGIPGGHNYGQILGLGINLSTDTTLHRELTTATSFTATTIVFPAGTFTGQDWTGASAYVKTAGSNAQQHRLVASNTATTLTLQGASWAGGTPTTPATVLLGSSYSSLYDRPGEVGGGGGSLHNGGVRIGRYYPAYSFGDLSFGHLWHPSSGVTWPDVYPNNTALWAWEAAGSYETALAGLYTPASKPWRPLIGLNTSNETRIGVNAALRFLLGTSGAWGAEVANLSTVGTWTVNGNLSFKGGTANPVNFVHAATATRNVTIQDLAGQTMAALGAANAGHLIFDEAGSYDVGAPVATRPRDIHAQRNIVLRGSSAHLTQYRLSVAAGATANAHPTLANPIGKLVINDDSSFGAEFYCQATAVKAVFRDDTTRWKSNDDGAMPSATATTISVYYDGAGNKKIKNNTAGTLVFEMFWHAR